MAPTLLQTLPNAKFIFTMWNTGCARWVSSLRKLFAEFAKHALYRSEIIRQGYHDLHSCVFNATNNGMRLPDDDAPLIYLCET